MNALFSNRHSRPQQVGLVLLCVLGLAWAAPAMAQLQGGNVYPINGTQNPPTSFGTITDAVTYMTANGVTGTGQVVLELATGYPGDAAPIVIPSISGASATLGITFRPAAGYTAVTSIAGTATNKFAIRITGNYITLDGQGGGGGGGRDWTIRCTGSGAAGNGESAVRLDNTSAAMTDITVRYCILEAEAANATSGILAITGGTGITMKNVTFANNLIRSTGVTNTTCRGYGVTVATASNAGNTGLVIRDNVVRDFYARGINFQGGFPGVLIARNDIAHTAAVTMPTTTEFSGIYYSTTASPGTQISSNFVHDIQLANGTTAANGIYLFNGNTSGNTNLIYNNRVAIGAGVVPTTFPIYGIRDNSVSLALFNVDYNSVHISGSPAAGTANSAAYRKEVSSSLRLRNNILMNARSNAGATGTHWGISINNQTNLLTINNNDYYASGVGGVLGTTDGTTAGNKTTLAAWKAAVAADVASVSQDPHYLNAGGSPPDLKIDTTIATQLESGGQIVTGIDADFEGDIRYGSVGYGGTGTAPDMGADEFAGIPLDLFPPTISYTLLGNSTSTTTRAFTNVTVTDPSGVNGDPGTRPRVYYKKLGDANTWVDNTNATNGWKYAEANGGASPFDFTIDYSLIFGGVVAPGDVVQYFVVAQDNAPTPNVGINSGTFASQPASVALPASAFPIGGTINSYTIVGSISGNFTVGSGGNYATLKAAFDDINAKVVTGNITLTILGTGTTETASAVLNTVSYEGGIWTITIKPDAALTAATPTITGSIAGALIKLNGADNVVIDGSNAAGGTSRDMTLSNTSTATGTAVVWLSSNGAGAGATGNTIKNCVILAGVDQSTSTNESFGIIMSGTSISISSGGADNDNNTFQNNEIRKARWGVYAVGISTNSNDNTAVTGNLIGPGAFGAEEIGRAGIVLQYQNLATVTRNEVRYVGVLFAQTAGGSDRVGIGIGGNSWTPTSTTVTNSTIARNLVHHVVDEKTFSAVGIVVAGSGSPSGNTVANNMIYQILANGTAGDQAVGIGISDGNGDKVAYNSVLLTGDLDPAGAGTASQSGVALRISSTTPSNLTLKDNILTADLSSNTATLKHYTIVAPSSGYSFGAGGSNNNDYYPKAGNAQMVLGGYGTSVPYTDVPTLAIWRTLFGGTQDTASLSSDPPFVSGTDLHLLADVPTPLESAGTPIAGVTDDYDGDLRNATTPDIGADEGNFTPQPANDIAAVAFVNPANGGSKIAGQDFSPEATFENRGSANQTNVPVRFRIVASDLTEVYNQTATIPTMNANAGPQSAVFPTANVATAGTYTMYAKAELPGDTVPANDEIVGTFSVLAPLVGSYDVGAAQAPPFHTLTAAVGALNTVGIAGSVVFNLVDASYTAPPETFPITINAYPGENPAYTVTIKPGITGVSITGTSSSALIVLNGCDYVVIDGSVGRSASRDLTITNTNTSTSSAVIWGQTATGPNAAAHNVVKNCNVVGSGNTQTLIGIGFGGTTISTTSNGTRNDLNTIQNNSISKSQYGIYSAGSTGTNKNQGTVITENEINTVSPNNVTIGGILVRFTNGVEISRNLVGEINRASGSNFGISLGFPASTNWISVAAGDTVYNAVVTRNKVASIVSPSATGYTAVGIAVAPAASGTTTIDNNMVSGVTSPATPSDFTVGIYTRSGTGSTTRIYFNSVSMTGSRGAATNPSLALAIAGTDPLVDIQDNVLFNSQTSTAGTPGKSYAIGLSYATYANLISNYNDLYVTGAQGVLGIVGGFTNTPAGDRANLAAWQTETGKDANSISADPLFAGTNDLHISAPPDGPLSPVANAGTALAGFTLDFDGDTRLAIPDIGADEFATYVLATAVVGNGTIVKGPDQPSYNPGSQVQLTANAAANWLFDSWSGDAAGNANPISITMDADKNVTGTFVYASALSVNDVQVTEGDAGTLNATFTVGLSVASTDTIRVHFATSDGTATAGADYLDTSLDLIFNPGTTSKQVDVPVVGDLLNEADETFNVTLSAPVNARITDPAGVGTILNNDPLPSLSVDDIQVTEGNPGLVAASFTVTLSAASGQVVTVKYATADGTAEAGGDYVALPEQLLTFSPGDSLTRSITVQVIEDLLPEGNEFFTLNLTDPVNATLQDPSGQCTIVDDDVVDGVEGSQVPAENFFGGNFPNPFQQRTTIYYGLRTPDLIQARIYDIQGRLVRELAGGTEAQGYHRVVWDGRDDQGNPVGAGFYFLKMRVADRTYHRRLVHLR